MKILITGGNGFIGSRLCQSLLAQEHQVDIIDVANLNSQNETNFQQRLQTYRKKMVQGSQYFQFSMIDVESLESYLKTQRPNLIFHLGMTSSAVEAQQFPKKAYDSIVIGTNTLIQKLTEQNFKAKVVYASSSMVYGHFNSDLVDEKHDLSPENEYGSYKKEAESVFFKSEFGQNLKSTIVRPISVYGPGDDDRRFVSKMILNALKYKKIVVRNPEVRTDLNFVDDVVDGFIKIGLNDIANNQIYNLSSAKSVSLIEVAKLIQQEIKNVQIEIEPISLDLKPVRRGALSNFKIQNELNYYPQTQPTNGIKRTIDYFKELLTIE